MTPVTYSITVGIIAGIGTAAVLFVINKLFNNTFVPWYRKLMYQGFNIAGKWHSNSLPVQKIVLELNQVCQFIKGKATYVLETEEEHDIDTIRTFDVTGEIKDRIVILNLKHTDPSRLGFVTFLLEVAGDGTLIEGVSAAYSPATNGISSSSFSFYRDERKAIHQRDLLKRKLDEKTLSKLFKREFIVLPKELRDKIESVQESSEQK